MCSSGDCGVDVQSLKQMCSKVHNCVARGNPDCHHRTTSFLLSLSRVLGTYETCPPLVVVHNHIGDKSFGWC